MALLAGRELSIRRRLAVLILGALVTVVATSLAGRVAARTQLGGVKPPGPGGDAGGGGGAAATGGKKPAPA